MKNVIRILLVLMLVAGNSFATDISTCQDLTSAGTYTLTQDVSSDNSCFYFSANGITLDLQGHTVTFGTDNNPKAFGIQMCTAGDPNYCNAAPSTPKYGSFVLKNGTLIQGGTGDNSAGVYIGGSLQVPGTQLIDNVIISVSGIDAYNIIGHALNSPDFTISNNIFNHSGTRVSNRDNRRAGNVKLTSIRGHSSVGGNVIIQNNTFNQSPNVGLTLSVYSTTDRPASLRVTGNTFSNDNAVVRNAFAINDIGMKGAALRVDNNTLSGTSMRGVFISSANVQVDNNTMDIAQKPLLNHTTEETDALWDPQGLGGTYGVQFEGAAGSGRIDNVNIFNNDIIVRTILESGFAIGVMVGADYDNGTKNIYSNTIQVIDNAAGSVCSLQHCQGSVINWNNTVGGYNFYNNIFKSNQNFITDTGSAAPGYPVLNEAVVDNNLFTLVNDNIAVPTFVRFYNGTGYAVDNLVLSDSTFSGGLAITDIDWRETANHGLSGIIYRWGVTLTVVDGASDPVSGATVTATDNSGATVCSGTTDASGVLRCILSDYKKSNTGADAPATTDLKPNVVTVSSAGKSTTANLSPTEAGTATITLSDAADIGAPRFRGSSMSGGWR